MTYVRIKALCSHFAGGGTGSVLKCAGLKFFSTFRAKACVFVAASIGVNGAAEAVERRLSSGELHWTSASLQGAAGIGSLSESWIDQAQTDVSLLARRKQSVEVTLFSPTVLVSRDAVQSVTDTVNAFTSKSTTSATTTAAQTTAAALDKVRSVFGKSMVVQENIPVLGVRIGRVGVAPYQTGVLDATIDNSAWPKLDAHVGGYAGVLISYAQALGKDFDLGVALRPGVGGYRGYQLDLSVLGDFMSESSSSSTQNQTDLLAFPSAVYVPLDLAAAWWIDSSTRIHLSSRNTFDAVPVSAISGSAGKMLSLLNLGATRQVALSGSKHQSLLVAAELQDLAGIKGGWNDLLLRTQWGGRYAVKLPFRDQTTFAVNAGLRSGYPVASVFFDFFLAKVEFAMSTREMGGYSGQRPSRLMTLTVLSQMQF